MTTLRLPQVSVVPLLVVPMAVVLGLGFYPGRSAAPCPARDQDPARGSLPSVSAQQSASVQERGRKTDEEPLYFLKPYNLYLSMATPTGQLHVYDAAGNEVTSSLQFFGDDPTLLSVSDSGLVTALRAETAEDYGTGVNVTVAGVWAVNYCIVRVLSQDYGLQFREYAKGNTILHSPVSVRGVDIDAVVRGYQIPTVNDYAYRDQFNLIGTIPCRGTPQIFTVVLGDAATGTPCGGNGNPMAFGWDLDGGWGGCYLGMSPLPGSPQWGIFYHELGHNFTWESPTFRSTVAIRDYSEGLATYIGLTSMKRIADYGHAFPLRHDARESLARIERGLRLDEYPGSLVAWLSAGAPFADLTSDIVDGILLHFEAENPSCFATRFFHVFRPESVSRLESIAQQVSNDAMRHTFFAAACSYAAGRDLHDTFSTAYHYPVDDAFYAEAYNALQTLPYNSTISLVSPSEGAASVEWPLAFDWTDVTGVVNYELYLGPSNPPPLVAQDILESSYTVLSTRKSLESDLIEALNRASLTGSGPLYWRVVAKRECGGDVESPVWTFSPTAPPGSIAAEFSWSPVTPAIGESIRFTDGSTGGIASWLWSFGDGDTSTEQNPVHEYATRGIHEVTLTVRDPGGSSSTTRNVTVVPVCPTRTARWAYGPTYAVDADGDHAYIGEGATLVVVDVSDRAQPVEVGSVALPSVVEGLAYSAGIVYVADRTGGLRIVDVSTAAAPREIGFLRTGDALDVAVAGSFAYVAAGWPGLKVIDISRPEAPAIVGVYDSPGWENGVAVEGNFAYVAAGEAGLRVVDVSNPAEPHEIGTFDTPGHANDVALSGHLALVADGPTGLRVIDVANPSSPVELGYFDTPGDAAGVDASGSAAYVADYWNGVSIVDLSNPSAPTEVGHLDTPGLALSVVVRAQTAYVADYLGLRLLDVVNPVSPQEVGALSGEEATQGVDVGGRLLYTANLSNGITVFDLADPAAPERLASFDTRGAAFDVAVLGDSLFVADGWGLAVVDVRNPGAPAHLGYLDLLGMVLGVAVSSNYAYLANDSEGLRVVDVSDARAPMLIGSVDTPGIAQQVAISGNYVYVADGEAGLRVIDVSNPAAPVERASVDTQGPAKGVTIAGNLALVAADFSGGVRVIDISDPLMPRELGSVLTQSVANQVVVLGTLMFVAADLGGFHVYSLARPDQPEWIASLETGAWATALTTAFGSAYVAVADAGLEVFDVSGCLAQTGPPVRRPRGRLSPTEE